MGGELLSSFKPSEDTACIDSSISLKPADLLPKSTGKNSSSSTVPTASVKDAENLAGVGNVATVYKFMHVCSDNQNGGLVNKVVLPQAEIKRFCNDFAPNSCSASKMDFSALDGVLQHCRGIAGQRLPILQFLDLVGAISNPATSGCEGYFVNAGPGIYGVSVAAPKSECEGTAKGTQCQDGMYVILWPPSAENATVESRSITATLMRYLTQLCGEVTVCLDNQDARTFPSMRKRVLPKRISKFKIGRELVEQDSFTLRPGFEVHRVAEPAGGSASTLLFPALDGVCLLSFQKMPPVRSYECQRIYMFKEGHNYVELEKLTKPFRVILSEEMPFDKKLDFFNSFSKTCSGDAKKCTALCAELEKNHKSILDRATEEVKKDHQQLVEAVDIVLHFEISQRIGKLWPDLGVSLIPDVPEEQLGTSQQRVASTGINLWEALGKIHPFSGYKGGLPFGLVERIAISVVVFLSTKSNSPTRQRVEGFLSWHYNRLFSDLQENSLSPWKTKTDPLALKVKVQELMEGDWKSVLEKDPKATAVLRDLLQQGVTKILKEKITIVMSAGNLSVTDRTQHRRMGMGEELNVARRALEEVWVQKMYQSAFKVCEVEIKSEKELATCAEVGTAEADAAKKLGEGGESGRLVMAVKGFGKDRQKKTYLEVEAESVQVSQVEVKVTQLAAKKGDVEVSGGEAVIPYQDVRGKLFIPSSHTLVGALLLKGRLLYVINHALAKGKRSSLCSFDFHNGVKRTLQGFPRPIRLAAFDDQLRFLALYVLEKKDGDIEAEGDAKEKLQGELSKSVEGVDEGSETESEPDSDTEYSGFLKSDVAFYRFDENWAKMSPAGKPCELLSLPGQPELQLLAFLPGGHVAAMLDTSNRIRLYQVRQQCVLTSQQTLPSDFRVASLVATPCGQCLTAVSHPNGNGEVEIRPFASHSLSPLPPVFLHESGDRGSWVVASFGGEEGKQVHLCSLQEGGKRVVSNVAIATSREKTQVITEQRSRDEEVQMELTFLENIFHVYDKFPLRGVVESTGASCEIFLQVLFSCSQELSQSQNLPMRVRNYLEGAVADLMKTKKLLEGMNLLENLFVACMPDSRSNFTFLSSPYKNCGEPVGQWLQRLICLVPIQIARAEENRFLVLSDGMLLPLEQARSVGECVKGIKLGMYAPILEAWKGPVVAVSSMGKQSTGKSYSLNHLFGTSFEISGGRCTDGCWMTLCRTETVLYVVLDFEGLGSFERTNQEDMLLSVFNAALSGFTIFKTEYRLDRDIEQMFGRFQSGVGLIKGDGRLFKGELCIAIKDVMARDVESVTREFRKKVGKMTAPDSVAGSGGQDFITMLYNGEFMILPFPPLGEEAYYTELSTIRMELEERENQFSSGSEFADTMKNLMAKLLLKDWSSLKRQAIESRLQYLEENLEAALMTGKVGGGDESDASGDGRFVCIDTQEPLPKKELLWYLGEDHPLKTLEEEDSFSLSDSDQFLPPANDLGARSQVLSKLMDLFEGSGARQSGTNHKEWFLRFSELVGAVVDCRVDLVQAWASKNLVRFRRGEMEGMEDSGGGGGVEDGVMDLDDEASKFLQSVEVRCRQLKQEWRVCGETCSDCYLRCINVSGHEESLHSCLGSHKCADACDFCEADGSMGACSEKMGHPGSHDCRQKDHTCDQPCSLQHCLNCNGTCAQKIGHAFTNPLASDHTLDQAAEQAKKVTDEGLSAHLCSSPAHLCGQPCSAAVCRGRCHVAFGKVHEVHVCTDQMCAWTCSVEGCTQMCCAQDHFHGSPHPALAPKEAGATSAPATSASATSALPVSEGGHFCGHSHACKSLCECPGICRVSMDAVQEEEFVGQRGTFRFKMVSEAKAERKECSIPIPPFSTTHKGTHKHSTDPGVVHSCNQLCLTCRYFCELPFGHVGVHEGAHGMMRGCHFVSDDKNIDIGPRKYMTGESGAAEMCDMFCRSMGRGHFHIRPCEAPHAALCTHSAREGRRHETVRYGPNENVPKDELTHDAHWATAGWKDPCSDLERQTFTLCNAACNHPSHLQNSDVETSYCQLPLWHAPPTAGVHHPCGQVSQDGHVYSCSHDVSDTSGLYHSILVLDESGSMRGQPWGDLVKAVQAFLRDRAERGGEDLVTIIEHNTSARIVCEALDVTSARHIYLQMEGLGNNFKRAFLLAHEVMLRSLAMHPRHQLVLIFMSDGYSRSGEREMEAIARSDANAKVFTVGFGAKCDNMKMRSLATLGNGTCLVSLTGAELKDAFLAISSRLGRRVSLVPNY